VSINSNYISKKERERERKRATTGRQSIAVIIIIKMLSTVYEREGRERTTKGGSGE
jgi:hypothetical protein